MAGKEKSYRPGLRILTGRPLILKGWTRPGVEEQGVKEVRVTGEGGPL